MFRKTRSAIRSISTGLLISLTVIISAYPQGVKSSAVLKDAAEEFENGNFERADELARIELLRAGKASSTPRKMAALTIIAEAEILLKKYERAEKTVRDLLAKADDPEIGREQRVKIYFLVSLFHRNRREFPRAFDYARRALALDPENERVKAEYFMNVGRILYLAAGDLSAVVWLEKAEELLKNRAAGPVLLETYRFLSLAWAGKANYRAALDYAEKFRVAAEKTRFKYKHRQALFESGTLMSGAGLERSARAVMEKGLALSIANRNAAQAKEFLHSLMLHALYERESSAAAKYLAELKEMDAGREYDYEIGLAEAVLAGYRNDAGTAEKIFTDLEKKSYSSFFLLPEWRKIVARQNRDWRKVIEINEKLLALNEQQNFRDELPLIYFDFAEAHYRLGDRTRASEYLRKSLALIEELRVSENDRLSLGLLEAHHRVYRLRAEMSANDPVRAFQAAEFLKARLLRDKIDASPLKASAPLFTPEMRRRLESLTVKHIEGQSAIEELAAIERSAASTIPERKPEIPDLVEDGRIDGLDHAAVVSYFFTAEGRLTAFVRERNEPVKSVRLPIDEDDCEALAGEAARKIKNLIYFKRDGREIYDKLLKPLNVTAKHLIIVPDKSLWKIPFQALSSDGERYLIEEKTISYAPSVSVLFDQLKRPKPARRSMRVFANSTFDGRTLRFVDGEAAAVAAVFDVKPQLNAAVDDFVRKSDVSDMLHFSMHARAEGEQPLSSYLSFASSKGEDGRLTVEELLSVKLKKGSLVFLASCDTSNVLAGEGLVSLAWAMMAAGATTVVSAQWEADDESTRMFSTVFYENYRKGMSAAEAMRLAAIGLIENKTGELHKPFYWAQFTLSGDFR